MRSFIAFTKKEITEQLRTGKLLILCILFVIFGVMNPAVAKLTPLILELLADSLAESGMTVTGVTVNAIDSWVQFFKNIPIALIAFVLLESGLFTREYETGTLVLSVTKGLSRYKVLFSKTFVLLALWTLGYLTCSRITYLYNAYFWDNSVAKSLDFSVFALWLFGVFVISLMVLFSTLSRSSSTVMLGTGGVAFGSYFFGFLPKVNNYLPSMLMDGNSLIYGVKSVDDYYCAITVTVIASAVMLAVSIPLFNKKQI